MGRMTETLRLVISGDSKGAVRALGETGRASKRLGDKMNTAANYALGAGVAMAGVIGQSMRTATDYYENGVDTINDLTNLSSEATTRLLGQTKAYGIEAETTGKAVKFFERNLDEARQGTETYLEAFERLGFTQEELKNLTDEEILFRTRDAMAGLEDTTSQTAIALQLFGRAGAELSDWYDVAPDEIDKVNKKLEELGLVWGDKEINTYQDMVDAQRDLQLTMLSLQLTIAKDVVPALTPLISQFGKLLQALRPIMPAIPYLTAGLFAFGGAVKAIRFGGMIRGMFGAKDAAGAMGKGVGGASGSLGRLRGMMSGLPGLISRNIAAIGAYTIAIAAVAVAVWATVKAFQEWRDAEAFLAKQKQERLENEASALDKIKKKYGENSEEYHKLAAEIMEMDRQIAEERKGQLHGLADWLDSWAKGSQDAWWLSSSAKFVNKVLGGAGSKIADWGQRHLAEGGTVKARAGGTLVIAAEAGEDEDFVPASKRAAYARAVLGEQRGVVPKASRLNGQAGGRVVFDFRGAHFSAHSPRELIEEMKRELSRDVRYANG